ncbi:MAG: HIT domain-containing protein [Rickettsiaceae bacterium]|nr:HIT domain-containing protein [Rickettsiaceae bacterium]
MENQYNHNNVFAKILKGEIPCTKVYENEYILAFQDIHPCAPKHVLVIPKKHYINFSDFIKNGEDSEITAYYKAIYQVISQFNLTSYRLVSNSGESSGQSVFHFHTHIISGKTLGNLTGA